MIDSRNTLPRTECACACILGAIGVCHWALKMVESKDLDFFFLLIIRVNKAIGAKFTYLI